MDEMTFKLREKLSSFLEADSNLAYRKLILFGAGNTYQLYKKSIEFENLDFECIWDHDLKKCTQGGGTQLKNVCTPETYISEYGVDDGLLVLIVSIGKARHEIKAELDSMGIRNMYMDAFLFRKHKLEVMRVFDLLCDDFSKRTYAHLILTRAGGEDRFPADIYHPDTYYAVPSFASVSNEEVFVDLGAYVGDTLETFIWKNCGGLKKVYLFEPDEKNAAALEIRVKRLKREWGIDDDRIEIIQAGIGSKNETLYIDSDDSGAPCPEKILDTQGDDKKAVKVYSMDEFFRDKQEKIDCIKADIESFEYDMLCGAKETIQRHHPRLAICIYHSAADMYRIPLLIKEYCPDYKFSIRHHSAMLADTVLYAYPDNPASWISSYE